MTDDRGALIRYRLERAVEALDEATVLLDAKHANACVSRLYYACFYAVTALLLSEGSGSSKHSGVRALFDREWVKSGRVPRELGRFYRRLFESRQESDYADLISYDEQAVRPWLEEAGSFVEAITARIIDQEKPL